MDADDAFYDACRRGDTFALRRMLEDAPADFEVNELLCAAANHIDVVRLLIARGANATYRNGRGDSALRCALRWRNLAVFEYLLPAYKLETDSESLRDLIGLAVKQPPDLRALSMLLHFPNARAALNGSAFQNDLVPVLGQIPLVPEIAERLLDAGAAADRPDFGNTALTTLLKNESVTMETAKRIVLALLRSFGDDASRRRLCVNAKSRDGDLPLVLAAGRNFPRVCDILIRAGADTTLADQNLRTPIENALVHNAFETLNLLWFYPMSRTIKAHSFKSGQGRMVRQQILGLAASLQMSKTASLRASLDPDIRDERFLEKLAAMYITKPYGQVSLAPWCFRGDLLQRMQQPPNMTGRILFACMQIDLPEPIGGTAPIRLLWYEWAAMLIARAFGINYKVPSADMFSRKRYADVWATLPHVDVPAKSYADVTGAAFRGDAAVPEFAAGILRRLGCDRLKTDLAGIMLRGIFVGCSERGSEGLIGPPTSGQPKDAKHFSCVLVCDAAYHTFIPYASTVGVTASCHVGDDVGLHAEIAEFDHMGDKSTVTMYESNFRGMQGIHNMLLLDEPCDDPLEGGWCQAWANLFSEERLFRGRRWTTALVEAYKKMLDTGEETPFYLGFKRLFGDADGKCELTRFARCLALRYFDAQRKIIERAGRVAPMQ